MAIDVRGHADAAVAQPLLDHFQGDALPEHDGGVAVPQAVKGHVRPDPQIFHKAAPPVRLELALTAVR